MATVPISGTSIRLLSGVPFSNDYKNTRWFDSLSQQTSYFLNKNVVFSKSEMNFQRIEGYNYMTVPKSIDDLWNTNYLMFQNAKYNNKWFYGFVTKLEYVQNGVTKVHFQIDVFQTWLFDMDFKPSFVVREHRPLWNSDGTPIINTLDEGLNYGSEYDTVKSVQFVPNGGYKWLVIVSKTPLHNEENKITPTVIGTPQPLSYYITPFKDDDMTPAVILPTGEGVPVSKPTDILKNIYKNEEAINNIVSFYVTDYTGIPTTFKAGSSDTNDTITFTNNKNIIKNVVVGEIGSSISTLYIEKVVEFESLEKQFFSDKYSSFKKSKESKLLMYPYCVTVIDDFKGNRTQYKNEYISSNDFTVKMKGSIGLSNKTSVNVPNYNHSSNNENRDKTSNESAMINNTPNDIPIINDMLSAFLQGNRNSLDTQRQTIQSANAFGVVGSSIGILGSAIAKSGLGMGAGATNLLGGMANSHFQLEAINSKLEDINNIPPQITKMGSNTAYDIGNGYNGFFVLCKQIKPEYQKKLENYFNMFGYKINEIKVPNFHTRKYWNYVQTVSCNILGNMNNDDLQELKSVFNNGITLWHTDDVGNYSLENEVI